MTEQPPWKIVRFRDVSGDIKETTSYFYYVNMFVKHPDAKDLAELYASEKFEKYPATRENLRKLSEYAEKAPAGMNVMHSYSSALIGGYFSIWDVAMAKEMIIRYSPHDAGARLVSN